jgi:hypothetical protein
MSNQPNPNVFFRGEDMGIGNFPIKGGTINDGGSAFPSPPSQHSNGFYSTGEGMTLRQYAAIKLRVPESGTDWLDDMIRKSNRDYFAAAALQGMLSDECIAGSVLQLAENTYSYADAMLKARETK